MKQFGFHVFIDSMFTEPAYDLLSFLLKNSSMFTKGRKRLISRRIKAVEDYFKVKFINCSNFPPDIIWQDYFQVDSFIPKSNSNVVDVGANIGDWAVIVGKCFSANVVAIEPVPSAFDCLLTNLQVNSLTSRVIAINCALGERAGFKKFEIDRKRGYANATNVYKVTMSQDSEDQYPLDTMDNVVDRLSLESVDLVKIDVEGSEFDVLKGCRKTIDKYKPKFIIEVHSPALKESVLNFFYECGYSLLFEKVNFCRTHLFISVLYLLPPS